MKEVFDVFAWALIVGAGFACGGLAFVTLCNDIGKVLGWAWKKIKLVWLEKVMRRIRRLDKERKAETAKDFEAGDTRERKEEMSKKTVEFEFDLDQLVKVTANEETGVVTMLALDDGGKKYYVQGKSDGQWWPERLLVAASD